MRNESEQLTHAYLRRRREERRQQHIRDRLIYAGCAVTIATCTAWLAVLEWSVLVAYIAAK